MKKYLVHVNGFTLIELLIVIALLGALAVGLIGAIDPFEQLKKGTDTGTRDLVSEFQQALIRYYAVKSSFPWLSPANQGGKDPYAETLDNTNEGSTGLSAAPTTGVMIPAIPLIVASGELVADFTTVQASKLGSVYVTANSLTGAAAVCYKPISKSFQSDPNTKYCADGTLPGSQNAGCSSKCISTGVAGNTDLCYWCIE